MATHSTACSSAHACISHAVHQCFCAPASGSKQHLLRRCHCRPSQCLLSSNLPALERVKNPQLDTVGLEKHLWPVLREGAAQSGGRCGLPFEGGVHMQQRLGGGGGMPRGGRPLQHPPTHSNPCTHCQPPAIECSERWKSSHSPRLSACPARDSSTSATTSFIGVSDWSTRHQQADSVTGRCPVRRASPAGTKLVCNLEVTCVSQP